MKIEVQHHVLSLVKNKLGEGHPLSHHVNMQAMFLIIASNWRRTTCKISVRAQHIENTIAVAPHDRKINVLGYMICCYVQFWRFEILDQWEKLSSFVESNMYIHVGAIVHF
jgi:hypothetical protein